MNEFANCPDLEELAAWIDGRVDEPTRRRLAAHAADCERCAEVVDGVLAFSEELAEAEDGSDADLESAEADTVPEASYAPEVLIPGTRGSARRWLPYLATALAASAVVVGIRWNLDQGPTAAQLRERARESLARSADEEGTRGTGNASDAEIQAAKACKVYLVEANPDPATETDLLRVCLLQGARIDIFAKAVADSPHFAEWRRLETLEAAACQVVLNRAVSGSKQQKLGYARCQEILGSSPR